MSGFSFVCDFCGKLFMRPKRLVGRRCCSRVCSQAQQEQGRRSFPEPPAEAGARWLQLGYGRFALVDEADFAQLNVHRWHYHRTSRERDIGYAARTIENRVMLYLHRVVAGVIGNTKVDHRNGNRLDDRQDNLRIATQTQNLGNQGLSTRNTSGYKGVNLRGARWRASIKIHRKQHTIGWFQHPQEAALAYDHAARQLFGEFARCNYPDES